MIHLYQYFISPLKPQTCRYFPTCSVYVSNVLEKHGLIKGGWFGIKRILRCNPWSAGGFDPAP